MPAMLPALVFAFTLLVALLNDPPSVDAAMLAPDVVPLAAAGPAGGLPTALASADLDGDGMPDLIVAYAAGNETTLVVYPGDAEAVYPTPGAARAVSATPFAAARTLATVAGRVATLTVADLDGDGLKDVVTEPTLGSAALLLGIGDGTLAAAEPIDAAMVATARSRAAVLAPRHLESIAPTALAAAPDVFRMALPNGETMGYRPSAAAKHALENPSKPAVLTPPADALAVLRMRLNADAIADLVVLRPGLSAPEVLISRAAATFVVTTTKDENGGCEASCSLREAIVAANATPDADLIEFAIPTSDPGFQPSTGTWLIQPKGTEYPVITEPVTIDGRTQPGFVDRPVIELNGGALVDDKVGLLLAASNSVVRGLVVSDWPALRENGEQFCGCAIDIAGGNNCIVEGNYVGTDALGTQARPNGQSGITVSFGQNNLIGGTTTQARNVVSGNKISFFFHAAVGTFISNSAGNNTFAGNYIGLDASGYNALPNQYGVLLNSANNTVGGTDPGAGNLVAGNSADQISIVEQGASADGNEILRNRVGLDVSGTKSFNEGFGYGVVSLDADSIVLGSAGNGNIVSGSDYGVFFRLGAHRSTSGHLVQGNTIGLDLFGRALGNGGPGVRLDNVFDANVGGTANGEANVVAFNGGPGVVVNLIPTCPSCTSGTLRSNQNRILSNRIFSNTSRGIDIGSSGFGDGVTPNDAGDGDSGANDLLNWPVLTSATSNASTSTVNAQALTQGPASGQPYRLQFFANAACDAGGTNGEGQIFLGEANRSADGNAVTVNLAVPIPSGYVVTATATDSLGNTSEFSNCVAASGGPAPVASATPTPLPTATPIRTLQPGETPAPTPTNVVGVENCDNCRDDDGDGLVDRADPDCPRPYVNGFGEGVSLPARAKAVAKCQATVAKQGSGVVAKEQKLLRACLQQMLACVETKPGDAGCLAKASTGCQKVSAAITTLFDKLEAKVEKACGDPPVAGADIVHPAGLGFRDEQSTCEASPYFAFGADDATGVARCVNKRHLCQAAQLVSQENPRARELLTLAGVNASNLSSCFLSPGASGGGQGVGDAARGKALVKCASGIQKAAAKYTQSRLGGLQ
ncbi:MAG: CSLREA domain-containing protein, partial [Candidatus Binatia bacterium]